MSKQVDNDEAFGATAAIAMLEESLAHEAASKLGLQGQQDIVLPSQIPTEQEDRPTQMSLKAKNAEDPASLLSGTGPREAALVAKHPATEPPVLLQLEACVESVHNYEESSRGDRDSTSQQGASGPRSVVSISDFFAFWAQEMHINQSEAYKKATELAENDLLWTTEDLYNLRDHGTFMLLQLPLHMKRWLFQERDRLLQDPAAFMHHSQSTIPQSPTSIATEQQLHERARRRSVTICTSSFPPVEVTVQVNSVSRLNVLEICYDIDFTLMLDWTDSSVIGMTPDEIQSGDIFNPDVIVDNVIGNDQPIAGSSTRPRVHRLQKGKCMDGHLKKTSRYRVTLTCPDLDLWAFPFDTQVLPIRLKARNHRIQEQAANHVDLPIVLYGPEGATGQCAADGLRRTGHSLDARADLLSEFWIHSLMGMRSDPPDRWYEMNIIIFRDPRHVLWNVAFPTLMMLLFAFSVYSIPIAEIGARMENTSTCLLAMMAFQGTIKEMLPPMPYITAMGRYVIITYVVLTCHGFEHAMFYILTSKPDPNGSGDGEGDDDYVDNLVEWRGQPADYLFGTVRFWTSKSAEPVRLERAVVLCELVCLLLFHITFVWYIRRLRHKGTLHREAEAVGHPGISLIAGCPQWGKRHSSDGTDPAMSLKSAGVTRKSM
mmetsp:Transcript_8129/g.18125  ORF Transcript_8129/g.18125 Transcript_8129/m.18125 type:complete len:657 (-) Transcript_8129:63-2033(-)